MCPKTSNSAARFINSIAASTYSDSLTVAGAVAGGPVPQSSPPPCPECSSAWLVAQSGRGSLCTSGFELRLIPAGRLGNAILGAANMLAVAEATSSVALFPAKPSQLDVLLGFAAENATRPVVLHDFAASGSVQRECRSALLEDG